MGSPEAVVPTFDDLTTILVGIVLADAETMGDGMSCRFCYMASFRRASSLNCVRGAAASRERERKSRAVN